MTTYLKHTRVISDIFVEEEDRGRRQKVGEDINSPSPSLLSHSLSLQSFSHHPSEKSSVTSSPRVPFFADGLWQRREKSFSHHIRNLFVFAHFHTWKRTYRNISIDVTFWIWMYLSIHPQWQNTLLVGMFSHWDYRDGCCLAVPMQKNHKHYPSKKI